MSDELEKTIEELEAEGYDEFKNLFSETLGETK